MVRTWLARVLRRKRRPTEPVAPNPGANGSTATRAQALGALGETLAAGELRRLGWPVLRNLVLSVPGHTVEIDAIVLLDDALMVLEVKTLSGLVVETGDVAVWERRGRSGSVRFQSPLVQNRWHVDAVRQVVDDDRVTVRGAVVSAGTARFSAEICDHVVQPAQLSALLGRAAGDRRSAPLLRAWVRLQHEASNHRAAARCIVRRWTRAHLRAETAVRGWGE